MVVLVVISISYAISQLGVDKIINYALPILLVFYPLLITVLFLTLSKASPVVSKYTTYTTFVVSIIDQIYPLPLHNQGFAWLIPALICYAGVTLIQIGNKNLK